MNTEAMTAVFGGQARSIFRAFDLMGIAEEEIAAAKHRYRRASKRVHAAFGVLYPTGDMSKCGDRLYRAHARELVERVARKEDTRPGTAA